jgi:hypothetical protein
VRLTKSGDPAIPKEVWRARARVHGQTATQIAELLQEFEPVAEEAFDRAHDGLPPEHRAGLALFDLVSDLTELCTRQRTQADACRELMAKVKKGRPKTASRAPVATNKLAAILLGVEMKPTTQKGRPRLHSKASERATFEAVEQLREELRTASKTATIKSAIESLLTEQAARTGRSAIRLINDQFNTVKALYTRGKAARLRSKSAS